MKDLDDSYPREHAERHLAAEPDTLTLDDLAQRLSVIRTETPLSVRDVRTLPIPTSAVYFRGEKQPETPHAVRTCPSRCVMVGA